MQKQDKNQKNKETSYRILDRKKSIQRNRSGRVGILVAGGLLLFFFIISLALGMKARSKTADEKIAKGVTIGGIDVSGMTRKEAKTALEEQIQDWSMATVELISADKDGAVESVTLPLLDFGFGLKGQTVDKLVEDAWNVGRKGFFPGRYFQLRKAGKKGIDIPVSFSVEEEQASKLLQEESKALEKAPKNASFSFEGETVSIIEGENGHTIDTDKTIASINQEIGSGWNKGQAISLTVSVQSEKPAVSVDMLQEATDVLGSYTTYYGGGDARSQNIEAAAVQIDGSILLPGEEFSCDAAMAPYTEEFGYTAAGSYENGSVVDTMGGGICQVSSTLYNAVLYSELSVTERYAHSMLVSYVDPGRDAAIADDVKDLKFANNTEAPIYIRVETDGGYVTATIYGKETRDPNREIVFSSEITDTEDYETRYVTDSDAYFGSMVTTQYGQEGASATLWKIVRVNGEETERTEENYSYYAAKNTIISVGVSTDNDSAASALSSAVYSQDADTIATAISQSYSSGE